MRTTQSLQPGSEPDLWRTAARKSVGANPSDGPHAEEQGTFNSAVMIASYLQRRLKLGYSRAARLIEIMQANGVVGPSQGSKPRDILVRADDYPPASGQTI